MRYVWYDMILHDEWYKIRCVDMMHNPDLCMETYDENDMKWTKMGGLSYVIMNKKVGISYIIVCSYIGKNTPISWWYKHIHDEARKQSLAPRECPASTAPRECLPNYERGLGGVRTDWWVHTRTCEPCVEQ